METKSKQRPRVEIVNSSVKNESIEMLSLKTLHIATIYLKFLVKSVT